MSSPLPIEIPDNPEVPAEPVIDAIARELVAAIKQAHKFQVAWRIAEQEKAVLQHQMTALQQELAKHNGNIEDTVVTQVDGRAN